MLTFIFRIYKSILSIIYLNLIYKKKTIFFYHPSKNLTNITKAVFDNFLKQFNNEYHIIYGHQSFKINKQKNYFFVNEQFLPLIRNINLFLSSYICNYFTKDSLRIYIHHDIYDTPVANNKILYQIKKRLNRYDHFFLPNKTSIKFFKKILTKKSKNHFHDIGYIKLDALRKRKKGKKNNSIIIAPTNIHSFPEFSIQNNLEEIIDYLISKTNYKIILRPHPTNINEIFYKNLENKFKINKRFFFDISSDYFNSYIKSDFLITDISGTAYTYSFLTNNPIIYNGKKKSILKRLKYNELDYFKDLSNIGFELKQINNLSELIYDIKKNKLKISKKIFLLRKRRFKNLDNSYFRFKTTLEKINV
jgi:hypothetical protein